MKLIAKEIESATQNGQEPFTIKSRFWLNKELFSSYSPAKPLVLDRNDVITEFQEGNTVLAILKALAWGYPQAMRKFKPIKQNLVLIREILDVESNLSEAALYRIYGGLAQIEGIGPSTLTKLLFFSEKSYNQIPCLILDERVLSAMKKFSDFDVLMQLPKKQSVSFYLHYLVKMDELAKELDITHEQIEMYLYTEGKN
jgi:hypothetical protein